MKKENEDLINKPSNNLESSDSTTTSRDQTAAGEEPTVTEPQAKSEPAAESGGMLTPEQIAALFDSQGDTQEDESKGIEAQPEEEVPAAVEKTLVTEPEPITAEPEPKNEPATEPGGMLTPEQIAALFDSQGDSQKDESTQIETQPEEVVPIAVEEPIATEPEPKNEPTAEPGGMLTPEQIAALFDSQKDESTHIEAQPEEEASAAVEETTAAEPIIPKTEPATEPSGMLTPEQIAALFDSQNDKQEDESTRKEAQTEQEAPVAVEETTAAEPIRPKTEPATEPSGILTPEQIATLFDSQSDKQEDESTLLETQPEEEIPAAVEETIVAEVKPITEPEPKSEPEPKTEPKSEPAAEPGGMLTPEQIAALFDSQGDSQKDESTQIEPQPEEVVPIAVEEPIATEPEPKNEPTAEPGGMLTPEQIAALFDSQKDESTHIEAQPEEEASAAVEETTAAEPIIPKTEPATEPSGMLTPEQIAALFDSQSDKQEDKSTLIETQPVEEAPATVEEPIVAEAEPITEPEPKNEPATEPSGMLTPEQIAALFDSQSDKQEDKSTLLETQPEEDVAATVEEPIVAEAEPITEPEPKSEPAAEPGGMLTPEQNAALFDSQSDNQEDESTLIETQPEDEASVAVEETTAAEPIIPKNEPTAEPGGMLTPEQIAALFDSQSDNQEDESTLLETQQEEDGPTAVEEPIVAEAEPITEPEPKTELAAESGGMLTPEQIAALFDSQVDKQEDESTLIEIQPEEVVPIAVEEPIATEPEPKSESAAEPGGMLTPEQIAALFDSQGDAKEDESTLIETQAEADIPAAVEEPIATEPETTTEPAAESGGMLTPEQIATLFDSQSDKQEDESTLIETQSEEDIPATVEETIVTEPEPKTEPAAEPGGMLTPEQIAALIDSQSDKEEDESTLIETQAEADIPAAVEDPIATEPEPKPEPTTEPAAESGGMLTPEQIAALIDSQSDKQEDESTLIETQPEEEALATIEEPIETEPEPKSESAAEPGGMLTPEQIAALIDSQSDKEEDESTLLEPQPDSETPIIETQPAEDPPTTIEETIATEPEADPIKSPASEKSSIVGRIIIPLQKLLSSITRKKTSKVVDTQDSVSELDKENKLQSEQDFPQSNPPEESTASEKSSIIGRIISPLNNLLSNLTRKKTTKGVDSLDSAQVNPLEESTEMIALSANETLDEIDEETSIDEVENIDDMALDTTDKSKKRKKDAKQKTPKQQKEKQKKSVLSVTLVVLGVMLLMSGSFFAGYFSRDYVSLFKPDPAKEAAQAAAKEKLAEEQAKEAENAKRAKELAAINPKDYTSSMYLDSIIIKGQAANKTSIKLVKIDDVSQLIQFPKLRRIRLYDMKGNEDLSVIQKLTGVEEIIIENSVLKNQFANGNFDSVKSIEMTDCTIEDSNQFANFKNVTELSADSTKFISKDGNLKITSFMPSLETLSLSNCGEYGELIGAQNLKYLKTLNLSNNTIVKNTSYVKNPQIESITVDISFVKNTDQLIALSGLKSLSTLNIQIGKSPINSIEMRAAINQILAEHPDVSITISTY